MERVRTRWNSGAESDEQSSGLLQAIHVETGYAIGRCLRHRVVKGSIAIEPSVSHRLELGRSCVVIFVVCTISPCAMLRWGSAYESVGRLDAARTQMPSDGVTTPNS